MIQYNTTDDPVETGVYACRLQTDFVGLYVDAFLRWSDNEWWYLGDHICRGDMIGWIGPLQR